MQIIHLLTHITNFGNIVTLYHKVLPIFYKVTPTNVKRLKGEFGDHFRDKEYMYKSDEPMIKQWKEAIVSVSHKFALALDEKRYECQFILLILCFIERRKTSLI